MQGMNSLSFFISLWSEDKNNKTYRTETLLVKIKGNLIKEIQKKVVEKKQKKYKLGKNIFCLQNMKCEPFKPYAESTLRT